MPEHVAPHAKLCLRTLAGSQASPKWQQWQNMRLVQHTQRFLGSSLQYIDNISTLSTPTGCSKHSIPIIPSFARATGYVSSFLVAIWIWKKSQEHCNFSSFISERTPLYMINVLNSSMSSMCNVSDSVKILSGAILGGGRLSLPPFCASSGSNGYHGRNLKEDEGWIYPPLR